eukprot:TRINITY_DN2259_c0_g1_i1.p1 TRINITY_DN2259_c0_g1~~TRINITY_DN2259_c0_g1_i1.p1  ORF type:complete len:1156 (+),score=163.57 TRINITY_DN2259_c0_g1_i1:68-3535(+)
MGSLAKWWFLLAAGIVTASADRSEKAINMPDLGRRFRLGEFYDATTDESVGGMLWPLSVLQNKAYVDEQPADSSNYKFAHSDSARDKLDLFDLSGELAFKYQSAVNVEVSGSAEFMTNSARSSRNVRSSVMYKLRTKKRSISLHDPQVREQMIPLGNIPPQATHVVSSIIYGGNLVATFEQKANSEEDVSKMGGHLEAKIKLTMIEISAKIELAMDTKSKVTSNDTSVYIFGDILPGVKDDGSVTSVPLDPESVVDYMASAHVKTVQEGGVPVWVTLTPIKWLITDLDRLVHELSNDVISRAADARSEFDEGLRLLNDLADEDNLGFLAWTWEVEAYRTAFQVFEVEYKTNLSSALVEFRRGGDMSAISDILNNFRNSMFTLPLVRKFSETQFDRLVSLRKMVSGIEAEGGVQMATRFSDYMANTFSSDYDAVIALVLAGMAPAKERDSMTVIRRFYAFAKRTLVHTEEGLAQHCKQAVQNESVGAGETCVEKYKLTIIHFDSFCSQFCRAEYCGSKIRSCEDAKASAQLDPTDDKEEWCRNPCTRVVAHFDQGPAKKASSLLPDILEAPTITSLVDDVVEPEPHNQRVVLIVEAPRGDVEILHWRVRISQFKYDEHVDKWRRHESFVETRTDEANVTLTGLTAGEKYVFEVAGVNAVDAGPYSEIYGSRSGVMIAYPILTIESKTRAHTASSAEPSSTCGLFDPFQRSETFNSSSAYSAPNWKVWDVDMYVSTLGPNRDQPSLVSFDLDEEGKSMHCGNLALDPDDSRKFSCSIPCNSIKETKTYTVRVWNPSKSKLMAERKLRHLEASSASCHEYQEGSVFCDVQDDSVWGCVARGGNAAQGEKVCSNCKDAQNEVTYYASNACSGNRCGVGKKWCRKSGMVNEGCITGECASECDPESIDGEAATGTVFCALPCHYTVPDSKALLVDGRAVRKLLPNHAANLTCATGYHSGGSEAQSQVRCTDNVQEDPFDLHDQSPGCAANKCTCSNGEGAKAADCPSDGDAKCQSCNVGYLLVGSACQHNQCTCSNGEGAKAADCPSDGDAKCHSCNDGYMLVGSACQAEVSCELRGGKYCLSEAPTCPPGTIHVTSRDDCSEGGQKLKFGWRTIDESSPGYPEGCFVWVLYGKEYVYFNTLGTTSSSVPDVQAVCMDAT